MTSEIPAWIQEIHPEAVTVSLSSYSTNGELFSSEGEVERFFSESWRRWRDIPERYGTPPHVFIMDFKGIRTLGLNNASNGFIFVLANFIGVGRPAYVAFDNLSFEGENNPWESLNLTVQHLRNDGMAVARREGKERYQLIGSRRFTEGKLQDIFTRLSFEKDWVEGKAFTRKDLNISLNPGTQRNYLHLMAKRGVVLQKNSGRSSYYRSLV